MDTVQTQYKKMTETPVNKLVITLGIPTTISMLVTSIYNIADTYFVSTLGTSASGATGIVFALMAILQAFGFMFGHGAGSNISRLLGSKNIERARNFSATSFYLAFSVSLIILFLGLSFLTPLVKLLGSTNSILPYAKNYATFILLAAPAFVESCVLNNILRYEGKALYSMIGLGFGGILNIFGDFILINCFHLGISGAGISTMVSQYISFIILLIPYLTHKISSSLNIKYFRFDFDIIYKIISVGFPSLVRQGLSSISTMILNQCAAPYGDAAIAALSIVTRVNQFLFCVGLGIGQGFQPVSSFNYGAKKYKRVRDAYHFTLIFGLCFILCMSVLGFSFAREIVTVFRDDPDVISIGTFTLRIQCLTLWGAPISVCGNMLFQSIGKSGRATLLASTRSGLVFIPIILLFSHCFGLLGIEIAQATTDVICACITYPISRSFINTLKE